MACLEMGWPCSDNTDESITATAVSLEAVLFSIFSQRRALFQMQAVYGVVSEGELLSCVPEAR